MHTHDLGPWIHHHVFDEGNPLAERGTRLVMWITAAMMVVEIVTGWWFNSMALLADGLHMSSHALAIGLSAFAYGGIADLHVWRVGKSSFACALTVVTHDPTLTPGHVRQQLAAHREIAHATIEVQRCG